MAKSLGRIFISYRRTETRHLAGRLFDRLAAQFGPDAVFMDVDTVQPGADFAETIDQAIASCDVFIAMIGPGWTTETDSNGRRRLGGDGDYVTLEVQTALNREILVIPVLVDNAEMPRADDLPPSLRKLARRNAVRLDHETFSTDVHRLIRAISEALVDHTPHDVSVQSRPDRDGPSRRNFGSESVGVVPSPLTSPTPVARRTGPARVPPNYRIAVRIGLWWAAFIVSIFATICIGLIFAEPSDIFSGASRLFAAIAVGVVIVALLRSEIDSQRRLHKESQPGDILVSESALSQKHVRLVAIALGTISLLVIVLFIALVALLPGGNVTG